jgi:RNA polymerase sigma-B factor
LIKDGNNLLGDVTEKANAKELFAEYAKTGDIGLRDKIVEQYLFLVEILAHKYQGKGVEYDDLYQVGAIALMLAVERFEPSRGFEFTSFATPTIIGEIKRYFRDKGWALSLPRRIKDLSLRLDETREEIFNLTGKAPTIPEIAEKLGVTDEDILEALENRNSYHTYSLNQALDENMSDADYVVSSVEKFTGIDEAGFSDIENAEFVQNVMKKLSKREQTILRDRVLGAKSQQELADEMGVSQMTISRLETDIRAKFKTEYYR